MGESTRRGALIPIALNLRNFMSYTEVHEPLRFDGIHVAVLTGDNGHGKSALLDAITWALWGRARSRSVDELIHSGATDMEVEFEFALDDHQYRVIRKRQRRGRGGYSDLQFAILADEGYRPLTERSVTETERAIERTLRMSYETFTNSSFIQQGRADSFTTNSPSERKRILAEILELGAYDELESRAKERFKTCEAQLLDERRLAQDWEAEIARRPTYQAELDRLRGELATLETHVTDLEQQLTLVRERVAQLDALQHQLDDTRARLERYNVERGRVSSGLSERQALRKEVQAVVSRAAEIERAAHDLDTVRHDLEAMTQTQQAFLPLERAREAAMRTLAAEQARLEGEVAQREKRLGELRQASAQLPTLQVQLRRAQTEGISLARVEAQHAQLQGVVGRSREDAAEKRTVNTHLKKEMFELRARLDELDTLSTCPTCKRAMDGRHKQRLRDELVRQGAQLRDEFRANESACRALDATIGRDEGLLSQAARALENREAVHRRLAQTEALVGQAEEALRQTGLLEQELADRQRALAEGRFATEARTAMKQLDARIAGLGYESTGMPSFAREPPRWRGPTVSDNCSSRRDSALTIWTRRSPSCRATSHAWSPSAARTRSAWQGCAARRRDWPASASGWLNWFSSRLRCTARGMRPEISVCTRRPNSTTARFWSASSATAWRDRMRSVASRASSATWRTRSGGAGCRR